MARAADLRSLIISPEEDLPMQNVSHDRPLHGHHKIAAALFVGALIVGSAIVLSAELIKPARYEFHAGADQRSYVVYDRDTGRATTAEVDSKDPTAPLK
jgi:hypothetical protein